MLDLIPDLPSDPYPFPPCFAKRGWKVLKINKTGVQKRPKKQKATLEEDRSGVPWRAWVALVAGTGR